MILDKYFAVMQRVMKCMLSQMMMVATTATTKKKKKHLVLDQGDAGFQFLQLGRIAG